MAEENKDNSKDPLDTAIDNITARLEDKFKSHDERLDTFGKNLAAEVKSIISPPEKKKSWLDDSEDDEAYVTKSDLKNMLRETVKEVRSDSKTVARSVVEEHSSKANRDVQSLRDHPEINTKENLQKVEQEMMARVSRGKNPEDPDLFADSVAAVYSRGVSQGWIVPSHLVKGRKDKDDADEDNFDMGGNPPKSNAGPSASSIAIARKMGLSEEKFKQIHEMKRLSR